VIFLITGVSVLHQDTVSAEKLPDWQTCW